MNNLNTYIIMIKSEKQFLKTQSIPGISSIFGNKDEFEKIYLV